MYLANLCDESKKLFLDMAYKMVFVDGEYSDSEKVMMNAYCYEMTIAADEINENISIEELVHKMNSVCLEQEKKVIVFELIGLAMADSNYDAKERELIEQLRCEFGLKQEFCTECEKMIDAYLKLQLSIDKVVIGDGFGNV